MDLGEEPEAKSAPFVARVARQMGATVFGLVILPKVSDGAVKCSKAIDPLQNLTPIPMLFTLTEATFIRELALG